MKSNKLVMSSPPTLPPPEGRKTLKLNVQFPRLLTSTTSKTSQKRGFEMQTVNVKPNPPCIIYQNTIFFLLKKRLTFQCKTRSPVFTCISELREKTNKKPSKQPNQCPLITVLMHPSHGVKALNHRTPVLQKLKLILDFIF